MEDKVDKSNMLQRFVICHDCKRLVMNYNKAADVSDDPLGQLENGEVSSFKKSDEPRVYTKEHNNVTVIVCHYCAKPRIGDSPADGTVLDIFKAVRYQCMYCERLHRLRGMSEQ